MPGDRAPALRSEWLQGEVAVIGLARSGRAAAMLLARAGATVYATAGGTSPEIEAAAATLRADGIAVETEGHDLARIARASLVVASPGVPPGAPPIAAARDANVEVVSEVEIALRFLPRLAYIAITGTNGKTTTTALAGRMLAALHARAAAAGNIGTALSELALSPSPPDWVALELSSFQLHDTPSIAPRVGVLTNLSPNHLDRYETVQDYYGDKALLFRNASDSSQWVSNADDADVRLMAHGVPGMHCRFSLERECDAYLDRERGQLVVLGHPVIHRDELGLLGDHNVANALAAALAVMIADGDHRNADAIARIGDVLRSFEPLEHRIEIVDEADDIMWINDSKSTNVASTIVALRGMQRPTILLLGGRHKGEPYTDLIPELQRIGKAVIAYGEAGPLVEGDLRAVVPLTRLGSSFDDVVAAARRMARAGDAVLLSPACSSYDMFDNYEHRGDEFKRLA